MTVTDWQPFTPKGDKSLKDMVLEGLRDEFPPLEPGAVIRYEDIAAWIGDSFPRQTGEYGERSYAPMPEVKDHLLKARGVLLLNVEGVGYKVADDSEKVAHAEREGYLSALSRMRYGNVVLGAVDRSKVSAADAALAEFMAKEMTEEQRVMRAKLRAQHKHDTRWS